MKLEDFIIKAFQNHAPKRLDWIRGLLCLINEDMEDYKNEPYPYRIVQRRDGIFFVDPENNHELTKIEGVRADQELVTVATPITLPKGCIANVKADTNTVVGNLILNYLILAVPFGDKIDFKTGVVEIGDIEKDIVQGMNKDEISVEEYIVYTRSLKFFEELADIVVPTSSEKTMTPPPGVVQLRNKLLKEVKDLSDPVELARVNAELVKYDAEYLKGDEAADGFLKSKKSRNEVRRKLFLTVGGEAGFGDGVTVKSVARSLNEGVAVKDFATLNSSSRAGSFNRGNNTMLGGSAFKVLIRSASNVAIVEEDCGSQIGTVEQITTSNYKQFEGRYLIVNGKTEKFDSSQLDKYVNKKVMLRSPRYCKSKDDGLCRCCAGDGLADHPEGIPVAVSDVGSDFLYLFMKKMHVSGLSTEKMDFNAVIS